MPRHRFTTSFPDKNGVVRIDRKLLGDRQHVQIYAEDLASAVWRSVALPEQPTKFRDLRLMRNLDPQKSFTQKKEVTVLKAGESLTFADVIAPEMAIFDSLASFYALCRTLNEATPPVAMTALAKFEWVFAMADAQGRGEAREVFRVCLPRTELLPFAQGSRVLRRRGAAVSTQQEGQDVSWTSSSLARI
jgi:hypothetical protein